MRKTIRYFLTLALLCLLALCALPMAASADESVLPDEPPTWLNPFADVSGYDWFYGDVQYAVEKGFFTGTSDTTFSPNEPLTRAMLVTILWRLEGESPQMLGTGSHFSDTEDGAYYATASLWAKNGGLVGGYGDNLFGPNDPIIRQDLAVILQRYIQYKQFSYIVTMDYCIYTDEAQIADYAKNAIQLMDKLGVIKGVSENTINPTGNATRAEAAAMLHRFLERLVRE